MAQREFKQIFPQPGWVEHNPMEIWSSQLAVASEAMALNNTKADEIAGIGITNQRETTIVWNKDTGEPIYNAIVWQCRRTAAMIEQLKKDGLEEMVIAKTGLIPDAYFSASKIAWILENVDGARELANQNKLLFGTVDTWLIYNLTGGKIHVTDYTNASRTMLFDIHQLCWDDELLAYFKIPKSMLPEVKPSSCVYGYTKEGILGGHIPVSGAAGDQQAALFGQTCFDAGNVKNTYGTGCFLLMNTKEKIIHSQHGLLTCVGWRIKGQTAYVLEGSVFVAGAAIQWLRDGLAIISSSSESESRAKQVNDCDGVYVVPSFTGLGAPYWKPQVKGGILGLTRGTKQEHIIRATIESLAYQTSDVVFAMQEDSGLAIKKMQVDGGASRNDFLLQFQSDILNTQVIRSTISETTALGAAYLAGLAVGVWKHQDDIRKQFQVASIFEPMMEEENRIAHLNGWKRAVHAIMEF